MKTLAALIIACLILPTAAAQEPSAPAFSSDLAKEQRWREQIVDSLMDGEAIDLDADGQTILGLDLFGQHDLEAVVSGAPGRAEAAAANVVYRQVQTAEADHFFDGQDEVLVELVSGWLDEVVPAGE